jgi:hypothetical protein
MCVTLRCVDTWHHRACVRACVQENGPTKGSFLDRSCALVPRALTGEHNGQVVRMHTPTDAQSMQLKLNQVRKRVFFAPFYAKSRTLAKTGSGQTSGKLQNDPFAYSCSSLEMEAEGKGGWRQRPSPLTHCSAAPPRSL